MWTLPTSPFISNGPFNNFPCNNAMWRIDSSIQSISESNEKSADYQTVSCPVLQCNSIPSLFLLLKKYFWIAPEWNLRFLPKKTGWNHQKKSNYRNLIKIHQVKINKPSTSTGSGLDPIIISYTPWKINMEPENYALEDDFPFQFSIPPQNPLPSPGCLSLLCFHRLNGSDATASSKAAGRGGRFRRSPPGSELREILRWCFLYQVMLQFTGIKGQGVTVWAPWYLLCSLGILGDLFTHKHPRKKPSNLSNQASSASFKKWRTKIAGSRWESGYKMGRCFFVLLAHKVCEKNICGIVPFLSRIQ